MSKNVKVNGLDYYGISKVQLNAVEGGTVIFVDADEAVPVINELTITENGTYEAPSGVHGYNPVVVNVAGGGGGEKILYMDAALLNAGGAYPVDADDYTTAVIPAEATFVSLEAFNNMPKLDTLIVNGNCEFELLEETVDKYVYYYNAITKNYIPIRKLTAKDRTEIPAHFMDGVGPMVEIEISGSVGESAFDECRYLKKATLENCLSIGRGAFYGCYALSKITLPDGLTSIGVNVFGHCYNLNEVTIPDSVTSIGQNAFQYCTSLTEVTIPGNVTYIGVSAFYNCTNMATITILGMETTIEAYSIPTTITIRGYAGSTAETYATTHGNPFEVIA